MGGEHPIDPALLDLMGAGPEPVQVPGLAAAIDKLPRKHRDVINAVFFERLSKVELAERLDVHRTVVDRLLSEALEALRIHLSLGQVQADKRRRIRPVSVPRKPRSPRDGAK